MCFNRLVERVSCRFRAFDPRLYQIASLGTLLTYGLLWLHFDVSIVQIALTFGTALLTQYAGTRLYKLPAFDPLSALVSAVGLCIFLRTNYMAVAALAAGIAIASKFTIRWQKKHIFNPTNLALLVVMTGGLGWISPGQWGQAAWLGFLIACLGASSSPGRTRGRHAVVSRLLRRSLDHTGAMAWRSAHDSLASTRKRHAPHFLLLHDHRSENHAGFSPGAPPLHLVGGAGCAMRAVCPVSSPRPALGFAHLLPARAFDRSVFSGLALRLG